MTNKTNERPMLKSCPFCGRAPIIHRPNNLHKGWYWINCGSSREECGVTPTTHHLFSLEEVVEAWNHRPREAALTEALKQAREALEKYQVRIGHGCISHDSHLCPSCDAAKELGKSAISTISSVLEQEPTK